MLFCTHPEITAVIGIPLGSRFCPRCNGNEKVKVHLFDEDGRSEWVERDCPYCKGKGYVTEEEYNKYWETDNDKEK